LDEIARTMEISLVTFRRRFTNEVGSSPAIWRTRRRMEAACHMMQYGQLTFAQISEQPGYSDEHHFSKRFKQIIGISPSEYRRKIRASLV
jgi:AraC-like DNA-binding protein